MITSLNITLYARTHKYIFEIKRFEGIIIKTKTILQIHCRFNIELMEKSVIIFGLRTLAASRWLCWCIMVVSRHIEFRLLRWLDNVLDWQNPLPQTGHLNGFSLTCIYLYVYRRKKKRVIRIVLDNIIYSSPYNIIYLYHAKFKNN